MKFYSYVFITYSTCLNLKRTSRAENKPSIHKQIDCEHWLGINPGQNVGCEFAVRLLGEYPRWKSPFNSGKLNARSFILFEFYRTDLPFDLFSVRMLFLPQSGRKKQLVQIQVRLKLANYIISICAYAHFMQKN